MQVPFHGSAITEVQKPRTTTVEKNETIVNANAVSLPRIRT